MKIAYFIPSLYNSAGMERVLTVKVNYLIEKMNYEVYIITNAQMDREVFFPLHPKVHLIHLNTHNTTKSKSENIFIRRLKNIRNQQYFYRKSKEVLENIKVDVVVSLSGSEVSFLNKIKDGSVKIAEYHFSKESNNIIYKYLSLHQKMLFRYNQFWFKRNMKLFRKFVVLTNGDKEDWGVGENIIVIPNPITLTISNEPSLKNKEILAVGRYETQKGFIRLINIWSKISLKFPEWKLKIKGDGSLKNDYLLLMRQLNVENSIILEEPSDDMESVYLNSSVFIMTSLYEGLPLSLIEAVSCGLPSIAFDCKHGPRDVIENNYNGFLIPDDDEALFIKCLEDMLENSTLRTQMSENAKIKAKEFELDTIMSKWHSLFDSLTNNN